MARLGVLVHVRHPLTMNWEEVVWGVPSEDKLGDLTKLVEILLLRGINQETLIIMGSMGVADNGMPDGEYTKTFLLDNFGKLSMFPRINKLMGKLTSRNRQKLLASLEQIYSPELRNTAEEIEVAADIFRTANVTEVVQITSASHGPRCVQLQAVARETGIIPRDQHWFMAITDICFKESTPMSTFVIEAPHRSDDPMANFKPRLADALLPYFHQLSPEHKKRLNRLIQEFVDTNKDRD